MRNFHVFVRCHNCTQERDRDDTTFVENLFYIFKPTEAGQPKAEGLYNHVKVPVQVEVAESDVVDVEELTSRSSRIYLAPVTLQQNWQHNHYLHHDVVSGFNTRMCSACAVPRIKYYHQQNIMTYTPGWIWSLNHCWWHCRSPFW